MPLTESIIERISHDRAGRGILELFDSDDPPGMTMSQSLNTVRYIRCLGCEEVHELTGTGCPHCRRCSLCGRKLETTETRCSCGGIDDSELVEKFLSQHEIPAAELPRERRRMEIRKQLAKRKAIISTVVSSLLSVIVGIGYREWFGKPLTLRELICLGAVIAFIALSSTLLVDRIFAIIEDRRLEEEFPPSL